MLSASNCICPPFMVVLIGASACSVRNAIVCFGKKSPTGTALYSVVRKGYETETTHIPLNCIPTIGW